MIDYIYEEFKLYLGIHLSYTKKFDGLKTKEEVYRKLDLEGDDYDCYMIVGRVRMGNQDCDCIVETGEIEHIQQVDKPKKKRRIK